MALVQCDASAASTACVFFGQGPSSNVSTTSPSRRKSWLLKCSKPKPGPPVVSISTTRLIPKALGLLHEDATIGGARGGVGEAWATTVGAFALALEALLAGASAVVTAGARPSAGTACTGKGAGPEPEVFCKKIAPKIATQITIASADAIAARRMSDLWDAASPQTPWTEFPPISLIPHLSGQFEAPGSGISKHYYMLEEAIMSARETAELLLLVGRLVQAEGYDGELSPAQWMALRFFARANSFSRTPSAFAEFQATTRGTASQAIKALEAGGYLVRQRSEADGRSVSLRLTNKGKKALARDPFEVLVRAVDSLDAKEQTAMHHTLHQVLTTVAASGAHRRFGVCQDCTYLGGEMCCNLTSASPSALECLLFGVPIQPEDAGLLCVHFQPTSEHRDSGHRE